MENWRTPAAGNSPSWGKIGRNFQFKLPGALQMDGLDNRRNQNIHGVINEQKLWALRHRKARRK